MRPADAARALGVSGPLTVMFALGALSAHAQVPRKVLVDLATLTPDHTSTIEVSIMEPFNVYLANRAPALRYRTVADLTIGPGNSRPPDRALHLANDIGLVPEQYRHPTMAATAPCDRLRQKLLDIAAIEKERLVVEADQDLKNELGSGECTSQGDRWLLTEGLELAVRPAVGHMTYALAPGDELRLAIERLNAAGAVDHSWTVLIRPATPDYGWRHPTEEQWIVDEITRDIAETLVWAGRRTAFDREALGLSVTAATSGARRPEYAISLRTGTESPALDLTVALEPHIWSPAVYAPLAQALVKRLKLAPASCTPDTSILTALTDVQVTTLETESRHVSERLARQPLCSSVHEEAALVLGAFGLRESAGFLTDSKWVLNRMATHLTLARALRGTGASRPEGRVAEAILAFLAGRQRDALDQLTALEATRTGENQASWIRALRLRITSDWRLVAEPAQATALERVALFGALRHAKDRLPALEQLRQWPALAISDWGRMALSSSFTVEEGHVFAPGIVDAVTRELDACWASYHGSTLEASHRVEALNALPSRLLQAEPGGHLVPRVIGWGAWSAHHARNLLCALHAQRAHLINLGLPEEREEHERRARDVWGTMRLWPLLEIGWIHYAKAPKDQPPITWPQRLERARDVCRAFAPILRDTPQEVPLAPWESRVKLCPEPPLSEYPKPEQWISPLLPGTAYHAYNRLSSDAFTHTEHLTPEQIAEIPAREAGAAALSPYDVTLADWVYRRRHPFVPEDLRRALEPMLDYNASALWHAVQVSEADEPATVALYERWAVLNPDVLFSLAAYLVDHGREDDAARVYERAFRSALDEVAAANRSNWLVNYYLDHGRQAEALALAQRAANTYSGAGLIVLAQLMEQLERYDEAIALYEAVERRYRDRRALDIFYIRDAHRRPGGRHTEQAAAALRRIFPGGLETVKPDSLPTNPMVWSGTAPQDAPLSVLSIAMLAPRARERLGLEPTDVVVALDGYRVTNSDQFYAVSTFKDDSAAVIMVWRKDHYVEIAGEFPHRRFDPPTPAPPGPPAH